MNRHSIAYMVAKNDLPYTDLPKLVDLHELNQCDMGVILLCDYVQRNYKLCIGLDEVEAGLCS